MSAHAGKKKQAWETPRHIVDVIAANTFRRTSFALDAAASAKNYKADAFYALPNGNGLRDPWVDATWCNPPYENQDEWIARAHWCSKAGVNSALLVLASTSANYWRPLVWERASVDFYEGRIPFVDEDTGKPMKGNAYASALVLIGPMFQPGRVRVRDASTGRLISQLPHAALELPFTESR